MTDVLEVPNLSDDDESEFEDAEENLPPSASLHDLSASIEDARLAVHYFFNNDFQLARKTLEPHAKTSMYHALGISVFEFLEAILTLDPQQIATASLALRQSLSVSNKNRFKAGFVSNTIGKMVPGKTNYDAYTEQEVHAELCYAEALLLKAVLTFVEDETLVSFIKASIKIRSCFNMYKACNVILKTRKWSDEVNKVHFESGVRMGIGTFNLMISLLPSRAIRLLEFIGFSGSKAVGLQELEHGYSLHNSIRQVLSVMTLLGYHLYVTYVITNNDGDLKLCDKILTDQLAIYPNGVWFLFFKGRLEFMQGKLEDAQKWYTKSWKSQNMWPQFHHICFWELMWVHCLQSNYREAANFADKLLQESKWSRTIYSYQKASMMLMSENLTADDKAVIEQLMVTAPKFKQKIAGKSLPMEKFIVRRANRYFAQKKWLCLPAIELMYLWSFIKPLSKKPDMLMETMKVIDRALNHVPRNEYEQDNRSLIHLLRGCVLRFLKMYLQAEECFAYVIENGRKLKEDTYLVPFAVFELALLETDQNNLTKAAAYLDEAKKNYTGYSMESRLHFRIHSAAMHLDDVRGKRRNS